MEAREEVEDRFGAARLVKAGHVRCEAGRVRYEVERVRGERSVRAHFVGLSVF